MKNYLKMTRDGFTLVELMIVVAIIGVLASIAVPQYSKFQAKSRQTEVKIQLGAAYTVEQSFAAENSTYSSCLGQIGYNRDGTKFYYTIGFSTANAAGSNCAPGATAGTCATSQWKYCNGVDTTQGCASGTINYVSLTTCTPADQSTSFAANIAEPSGSTAATASKTTEADLTQTAITSTGFTIEGAGVILSKAAKQDQWTIDQNKQILNFQSGLN